MKNVILTPNPYRDRNFQLRVRSAIQDILKRRRAFETAICACPSRSRPQLTSCRKIVRSARTWTENCRPMPSMLICFGGDGTILHAGQGGDLRRGVPLLGVNIGTMGFMAELESTELEKLADAGHRGIHRGKAHDAGRRRCSAGRDILFHDICSERRGDHQGRDRQNRASLRKMRRRAGHGAAAATA